MVSETEDPQYETTTPTSEEAVSSRIIAKQIRKCTTQISTAPDSGLNLDQIVWTAHGADILTTTLLELWIVCVPMWQGGYMSDSSGCIFFSVRQNGVVLSIWIGVLGWFYLALFLSYPLLVGYNIKRYKRLICWWSIMFLCYWYALPHSCQLGPLVLFKFLCEVRGWGRSDVSVRWTCV